MQGAGFRIQGAGFRVQDSGFRVQDSGCRVQGAGFRVQGSEFRVHGSGRGVQGLWLRISDALVPSSSGSSLRLFDGAASMSSESCGSRLRVEG